MIDAETSAIYHRLIAALEKGAAIPYDLGIPDKEYPEVSWSKYGLAESNEIVVIAAVGHVQFATAATSWLFRPPMRDRIYGIDIADERLSLELSERLWDMYSEQLIAAAMSVR